MQITNTFIPSLILSGFVAIDGSNLGAIARPPAVADPQGIEQTRCQARSSGTLLARTELFFGLGKANGTDVSDSEFQGFLDREVTPRFPEGLTVLAGQGQFTNSSRVIVKEPSRLLILFYPIRQENNRTRQIEEIRRAYKKAFQQESVLRTDDLSCVSF